MNERIKILNRIRALLSKTVENGCTEAEALAALNLASNMMDAYEVSLEDIELKGESAIIQANTKRDPHLIRQSLAVMISKFCDCRVWRERKGGINFCGMQSDIDFAFWLLDTLSDFVTNELVKYLPWSYDSAAEKRRAIAGFVMGCTRRINERFRELIEARTIKAPANSKALVVAKSALINQVMSNAGIYTQPARRSSRDVEGKALKAGYAAGDRANFGRPIAGGQRLIGRR